MLCKSRSLRCCAVAVSVALVAGPLPAANVSSTGGGGNWYDTGTWQGGSVPTGVDDVTVESGDTVTVTGLSVIAISSLTVDGVLEHAANSSTEAHKVILAITNDCEIAAGGSIDVSDRGYAADQGPGYGANNSAGSHGGQGAGFGTIGSTYGSIVAPTNLGSGGGHHPGGGAAILTVAGETRLYGSIQASATLTGNWQYPGAGGSVFLTTSNLVGNGTIQANSGGASQVSGGGGRIAVVLTGSDSFGSVTMTAHPNNAGTDGAAGTVYLEKQSDPVGQGELVIDQTNLTSGVRPETTMSDVEAKSYQFSRFTATNAGVFVVGADDALDITGATLTGDAIATSEGIRVDGGTLTVGAGWALSNITVTLRAGSTFIPGTSVTIATNGILAIDAPRTLAGDVTIEAGGALTHSANGSTEAYKLDLTVLGDLVVNSNGAVDVSDKGYAADQGPGYGANNSAGSHGGVGAGGGARPTDRSSRRRTLAVAAARIRGAAPRS